MAILVFQKNTKNINGLKDHPMLNSSGEDHLGFLINIKGIVISYYAKHVSHDQKAYQQHISGNRTSQLFIL